MSEQEKNAKMASRSGGWLLGEMFHSTAQTLDNMTIEGWVGRDIQKIFIELADKLKITESWELPKIIKKLRVNSFAALVIYENGNLYLKLVSLSKWWMWVGELEGKYLVGSDASLNRVISLCDCSLCGKKMRTRGSPLTSVNSTPGWTDVVRVGEGLDEWGFVDRGILHRIIIALSAWGWIYIWCSHPRDQHIQVWRGHVE